MRKSFIGWGQGGIWMMMRIAKKQKSLRLARVNANVTTRQPFLKDNKRIKRPIIITTS